MKETALITGGTRGIGFGIAIKLAQEGVDLAINGVRAEDQVEDKLKILKESGIQVIYCPGDISKRDNRQLILEKVKNEFGHLNL